MPMIVDTPLEFGRKYGVVDEGQGIETRVRFIVDLNGILRVMLSGRPRG